MTTRNQDGTRRRGGPRVRAALLLAALAAGLGACDGLLEVDTPSRIPAGGLESPANAPLLVNGAVADFECAFGAYVVIGGLIGEELIDATQTADRFPYDSRNIRSADRRYSAFSCEALGVYTPLNTARASADNAVAKLQAWTDAEVPNRQTLLARAALYAGYSLVLLGEGFCSGVISNIGPTGELVYGTEMTRAQLLAEAEARFGIAIAAATAANNTELLNAARVGRARARLDQGEYAEAREDAAAVPASFVFNVTASGTNDRRQNRVWSQSSATSTATSVGTFYHTLDDPRVPSVDRGTSSVTGVRIWQQLKYTAPTSPIPLATGREAQLIVAEADIRSSQTVPTSVTATLTEFRASGNQGPSTATTQDEALAELIDQRRRELFLTGHHLGDVIRFNIPLSPAAGTTYHGGGTYGSSTCMPLPDIERMNNPNLGAA